MSYRFEKTQTGTDIVISGFENGIANSPYEGIGDMRNVNITTSPMQASVMFASSAIVLPPVGYTAVAFSSDAATNVFTVATTVGFYTGMALSIVSVSGSGSGLAGQTYYVGDITPTTFKLYDDLSLNFVLDVTTNRTGTFTIHTFGTPTDSVSSPADIYGTIIGGNFNYTFVMCSDGLVWAISPIDKIGIGGTVAINSLQFLGNLGHSTSAGASNTGIVYWKGFLFAFMASKIDYLPVDLFGTRPSSTWQYGWKNTNPTFFGHRAIPATDDAIYFCNGVSVGSLLQNAGATFDPTDSTTYTYNDNALAIPINDAATCIAQLGVSLLVGGILNYIYPWDRISTSFSYPLIVAESFTKCIVSTNSTAYIFAGEKGRIYLTNGANIQSFKKFPDSLSGTSEPYFTWGWGIYLKNQLYFSISARRNEGSILNEFAGIWAIDLDSSALRLTNELSFGTYVGTVPVMVQMGMPYPTGDGIYTGWVSGTNTGMDFTSPDPYLNYESFIETDIIPVGTFLGKENFTGVEFKLSKPLVAGESIQLLSRYDLVSSFNLLGTNSNVGTLSDVFLPNFSNIQWLQIRAQMSSTVTNPSYVPLLEIRLKR